MELIITNYTWKEKKMKMNFLKDLKRYLKFERRKIMTGFDRLKNMLEEWLKEHKNDEAFIQTVNYLLERPDLEQRYLNEEKTLKGLNDFIQQKGRSHLLNGWCYITNEVVYSWAVIYFALPNSFLKIKQKDDKKATTKKSNTKKTNSKNNVVSLEEAKQKIEQKQQNEQISIFGGVAQ